MFVFIEFTDISEKYSAHEDAHLNEDAVILNLPSFDSKCLMLVNS